MPGAVLIEVSESHHGAVEVPTLSIRLARIDAF